MATFDQMGEETVLPAKIRSEKNAPDCLAVRGVQAINMAPLPQDDRGVLLLPDQLQKSLKTRTSLLVGP